ncbi:MAG TPA: site-specific integrase [Propionibacteriaceae bacterium]|nr:site-specific integrase [Propionibacteriaceae bacterium]
MLSLILAAAVKDNRLFKNPAAAIQLPPPPESEQRHLTHQQLGDLANLAGPEWRLPLLFLGYTGLRFGEMAALRVGRLDLNTRVAAVRESVTPVKGVMTWGTPKTHASRDVPIPRFLIPELAELTAGKDDNELVFLGARGAVMRAQTVQRAGLTEAGAQIGKSGFHPHELRHTAASLAIAGGADIKVVQQMLGHKSATMTWDLYGHLFPNRLQEVAEALDQGARAADAYKKRTKAEITAQRQAA